MPRTCASAWLSRASESRNVHISLVQTELNAAGKNASTTGLPRSPHRVTGCRSWFVNVKSGAFDPTSTDMRCLLQSPTAVHGGRGARPRRAGGRKGPSYNFSRASVRIFGWFSPQRSISVIEVQHLTKRYGRVTAVDDVSFRVEPGEILGFLGPNGAGKTTTMRILTGYMPASEGRATVAGYDVFTHPIEAKRRTGYLPETPPLYPDMTIREYLDFVARIKAVPSGERQSRVDAVMKRTHVDDVASRACGKLSKGYRQRVGLAQAIIHNPEVLILDEPTAGLDPKQIIETRELIKELAGDHTIILSTHILPEVSQTCQRVVIINKGRVVAVDTPDNLTARLRGSATLYVQVDAGDADAASVLSHVPGVARVAESERRNGLVGLEVDTETGRDVRRDLARTIVTSGWGLLELRPMRVSLEDVFLSLTTTDEPPAAAREEAAAAEVAPAEEAPHA